MVKVRGSTRDNGVRRYWAVRNNTGTGCFMVKK